MPDLLDRLKTALADRYAIERERAGGKALPKGLKKPDKRPRGEAIRRRDAGFRSLRDRLIPSVAVGSVTVPVTVSELVNPNQACRCPSRFPVRSIA